MHASHDVQETSLAGRTAFLERFEREVDPEGVLSLEERQRRARYAKSAYFTRLVLQRELKKSTKKRQNADPAAARESASAAITAGGADRGSDDQQSQPV